MREGRQGGDNCQWLHPGVCVWWRETGWREKVTVSSVASCCVRFREQWVAENHLMWKASEKCSYEWQTKCVGSQTRDCVCVRPWARVCVCVCTCSVTSHCLGLLSRSVSLTDEHALPLKGIRLRWFRITWALWLYLRQLPLLYYNDII